MRPAQPAINSEALVQGALALDEERRLIRYHGQALELSRYEYGLLAAAGMSKPPRIARGFVELWGLEPQTPCMPCKCSTN